MLNFVRVIMIIPISEAPLAAVIKFRPLTGEVIILSLSL